MKKIIWILVGVLIVAGLVAVRAKRMRAKQNAPVLKTVPIAVNVARVVEKKVVHTRHVLGTVIGADEASIAPRLMAQVMEVKVRQGDVVRQGQLLATLDPREVQDAVAKVQAEVMAARQGLSAARIADYTQRDVTARDKILFEAKAISQEQWDHSRAAKAAAAARLAAARAQLQIAAKSLDQAKTRLGYTRLASPFDGVVAQRLADPGDLTLPGKPLLVIVRNASARVRAELPPEDFPILTVGRPVMLSLNGLKVKAAIARIFPAMGTSHLAVIEADLASPPPGFISGATVGVDVQLSSARGLAVPADALLEGQNGAWVFCVRDDTVCPLKVTILDRSLNRAVVAGDLKSGDKVIVARPARLMTFAQGVKVHVAGIISATQTGGTKTLRHHPEGSNS